jgi:hypothetical protein
MIMITDMTMVLVLVEQKNLSLMVDVVATKF